MNRKIISVALSLSMIFSVLPAQSYIFADKLPDISRQESENSENINDNSSPALQDLIRQADNDYKDNDEIKIIVSVNDKTMIQKYGMNVPDLKKLRTEDGLDDRVEYSRESQEKLIDQIEDKDVNFDVTERYDAALNGLAIKTTFKDAKVIAQLPEVNSIEISKVIPAPVMTSGNIMRPVDFSSNDMVGTGSAWQSKYTGKGKLIAIIDSGADPNHEIFKKTDDEHLRFKTKEQMDSYLKDKGINYPGDRWFNKKIVYGYNYADKSSDIKEKSQTSHGMHVAGIIAANLDDKFNQQGKLIKKGLKGVAYDSQLAILRVFGGGMLGGGTTPEIYNKAIDDAVKLGADSINMSLGATGTTDSRLEKTTIEALKNAQQAGIVVAIAAGNDGFMGFQILDGPPSTQLDYGLINSPGIADLSLTVASVDNATMREKGIKIIGGAGEKTIPFQISADKIEFTTDEKEYVEIGYGYEEDYNNKNVEGKYALIKRGEPDGGKILNFSDKVKNAEKKGAIGAIVYNNIDETDLTSMGGINAKIPSCFISKNDGEYLKNNPNLKLQFTNSDSVMENPNSYNLSSFSSWGVTPEGNIKPDISAPGGKIYSSINNDEYTVMSGTSMATPHVAGGIAIVKEYVEKTFPNVMNAEKHSLIKNLLMSTATPREDKKTGAYMSPRGQGAGLMNLKNAIKASVVAIGKNGVSSINLRNLDTNKIEIKGQLKNYSNEKKEFNYYADLNTDTVEGGRILLKPQKIDSTKNSKKSITVPANGTADFEVNFTLSDSDYEKFKAQMPNGFFLEGFVFFENSDSEQNISIPFVGFRGTWEKLQIIEDSIYKMSKENKKPYFYTETISQYLDAPFTHISSINEGKPVVLGRGEDSTFEKPVFDENKIAISPNGDGRSDRAVFVGTFLRNYKDFKINIYDENEENGVKKDYPIYTVEEQDDDGQKNFFNQNFPGTFNLSTTKSHWKWEGINNSSETVVDGKYKMVVEAKLDGYNLEPQKMEFPIIVDTVFPRIVKSSYDESTRIYKLEQVEEKDSGVRSSVIVYGDKIYKPDSDGKFERLPESVDTTEAKIKIQDNAYNVLELPLDKSIRTGNEKTILVKPKLSSATIPSNKFKWKVLDAQGKGADPYNLKVGKYTLVIESVDEEYELLSPKEIPFEITESDTQKVVEVEFAHKDREEAVLSMSNPYGAKFRLILADKETGKEYELNKKNEQLYMGFVPVGDYRIIIRDLSDDFYALITGGDYLPVRKNKTEYGINITISKKKMYPVTVNIQRNGYDSEFDVLFRGKDLYKTRYYLHFNKGEDSKKIKLPGKLPFEIYTTNFKAGNYGSDIINKEFLLGEYSVDIKLVSGMSSKPVPVEKEPLLLKIIQAKNLDKDDYKEESWEIFKDALELAQNTYDKANASQEEVDKALSDLTKAINSLELKKQEFSKKDLEEKIKKAEEIFDSLGDDYTNTSKDYLSTMIKMGKAMLQNKKATQEDIKIAIEAIDRAIKNLERKDGKIDTRELKELLEEIKNIIDNKNNYYEDNAMENLEARYKSAKELLESPDITVEDMERTISSLRLYLSKIKSKAERSVLRDKIEEYKNINLDLYKLDTKLEFIRALREAESVLKDNLALQDKIDKAVEKLETAKNNLILKDGSDDKYDYSINNISVTTDTILNISSSIKPNKGDKFKSGDRVKIYFEGREDAKKYKITNISVITGKYGRGVRVRRFDNSFLMPNDDVNINVEVDEHDKTVVLIPDVSKGVATTQAQLQPENIIDKKVNISLSTTSNREVKKVVLTLPKEVLSKLVEEDVENVSISFGDVAKLELNKEMINNLRSDDKDVNFSLKLLNISEVDMNKLKALNKNYGEKLEKELKYIVEIKKDDEEHSNFNADKIKVTLPYTKPDESDFDVLYLDDNTDANKLVPISITNANYDEDEQVITFYTDHFSKFAIQEIDKEELIKEVDSSKEIESKLSAYENIGQVEFKEALKRAEEVLNKSKIEKGDIKKALEELKEKREALKLKPNNNNGKKPSTPGSNGGGGGGGVASTQTVNPAVKKGELSKQYLDIKSKIDAKIQKILDNKNLYSKETLKEVQDAFEAFRYGVRDSKALLDTVLEKARIERITNILKMGYMSGYPNNTFKPDGKITRAEVAVMFLTLVDPDEDKNIKLPFTDVKPGSWYADSVLQLDKLGYFKLSSSDKFEPNKNITRAEVAFIIAKLKKLDAGTKTFKDVSEEHWALRAISACADAGIISGYADETFKPDEQISRAEMVSMLSRAFDIKPNIEGKKAYSDVKQSHWAYNYIVSARKNK
ncbi:MAG: S8 family serine peptidase [Peptoanaerobacter stomatis]|uniref:S8 family serine peptidase n=1 Tax=Peptoanaerobacter stomatis TaxID=796937 RepID=UPI003F9F8A23